MLKLRKPTSKNAKNNLPQTKRIPRISTRGFYDLSSGKTLRKKPYDLYPKKFFEDLGKFPEFTIMIHGLRNNEDGALSKFQIAQKRLWQLGYKYPVIGFSYDSNTKGIQYKSCEANAARIGKIIAQKNGKNLAKFILTFKKKNPNTKIRLMGHSLGTEVIFHTLVNLKHTKSIIEAVYFFGGSLPADFADQKNFDKILQSTIRKKILNYYSRHDEVLKRAYEEHLIEKPIGYVGMLGKAVSKYSQIQVKPKNHRFASYAAVLNSFH